MIRSTISFFVIGIAFCFCSCKDPEYHCVGQYACDINLVLKIQDEHGNNLLNSRYVEDSIKLYHIFPDGCKIYYYSQSSDNKKGFTMYNDAIVIALLSVLGDVHGSEVYGLQPDLTDSCRMFIEWNSQETDTIFTTFIHLSSTKDNPLPYGICVWDLYDKVYYNGKLIVSSLADNVEKMSQGIFPTIIK